MRRISTFLFLGFAVGFILVSIYINYGLFWKYSGMKESMGAYLEDKYKEEFVLGNIRFDWRDGGSYYTYALATSTNSEFYVEVNKEENFSDDYVYAYWASEALAVLKPIISESFDTRDSVGVDLYFDERIVDRNSLKDQKSSVLWDIYISAPYEIDEEEQRQEIKNINHLINSFKVNGIRLRKLEINYLGIQFSLTENDLLSLPNLKDLENHMLVVE